MKKLILGFAALASLAIGGLYYSSISKNADIVSSPSPSTGVLGATPLPGGDIQTTPAFDGDQITLIPNFTDPKPSEEILRDNDCDYLINGGFYTKEGKPVGLFQSGEETIRGSHESELFDGFLTINKIGTPRITRNVPKDPLNIAIQLGPVLVENASPIRLKIKNDEETRRMVAIVTGENKIIFMVVQKAYLSTLPERIVSWSKSENVHLADAINLDGGSASAFRGPEFVFPEVTPIGSAFCVKANE